MILCKKCGYDGKYTGVICPECKNRIVLDTATMNLLRREISEHLTRGGRREDVAEKYRILADMGDAEAQREYGMLLERGGGGIARNIDLAMDFFHLAAKSGDADESQQDKDVQKHCRFSVRRQFIQCQRCDYHQEKIQHLSEKYRADLPQD